MNTYYIHILEKGRGMCRSLPRLTKMLIAQVVKIINDLTCLKSGQFEQKFLCLYYIKFLVKKLPEAFETYKNYQILPYQGRVKDEMAS